MPAAIDLKGQRFGRLLVLERAENNGGPVRWNCRCDCGNEPVISTAGFRHWNTRSCGCLQRERAGDASRTHGESKTPTYRVWKNMRARCLSPTNQDYAYYGGRGIKVCPEWLSDFTAFKRDMGPRPPGATIDRKDFNGPYSPENCEWATRLQQGRNRRSVRLLVVNGRRMCLTEACERYGQNYSRVKDRLAHGWDLNEALTTPSLGTGRSRISRPAKVTERLEERE